MSECQSDLAQAQEQEQEHSDAFSAEACSGIDERPQSVSSPQGAPKISKQVTAKRKGLLSFVEDGTRSIAR